MSEHPLFEEGKTVAEFLAAEKERKAEKEAARQAELERREAKQEEQRRRDQAVAEDAARGRRWQRQADAEQQQDEPIDYRATYAMCVCVFGAGLLFYFAFMHTVTAPDSQVLNMGLLQDRLIGCHVGIGLLCAGLVMWGLSMLPREK